MGSLFIQPFSIRILDATEWGKVGLATVILQVGQVILSAGLPLAITKAYYTPVSGHLHARAIAGANYIVSLLIAIIAAIALAGSLTPDSGGYGFVWAILAVGLLSTVVGAQAVLRAQERPLAFILLSGGASLGSHLLGLSAILVFGHSASIYLAAFAIGMLATASVGFWLTRPAWPSAAWKQVKIAFRLGLPVMPHSLAIILLMQGDSFLLQVNQGNESVGRYVAAAAFALGPFAVLAGLNNVWMARIMQASQGRNFQEVVSSVAKEGAWISCIVAVAASSAATLGIHILKGDDNTVMQLAKVLPLATVGYALYLVCMSVLFAMHKTGSFAIASPLLAVIAGFAALYPARTNDLVLLGLVKGLAFVGLGLIFLWLVRRANGPRVQTKFFMAALVTSGTATGLLFLLPDSLLVGVATVVIAGLIAALFGAIYMKRNKRMTAFPGGTPTPSNFSTSNRKQGK
ncbi:oligosaccharide flippase family protein [Specibacter sp. NPDC078709]|uniref:lipopolysaccharide biosynthesis protein n=1 Tax=Specibacter sp. NPDC078709 TaxID=3154364 RepID=UPI003448A322